MNRLFQLLFLSAGLICGQNCTWSLGTITVPGSVGPLDNRTSGCINFTMSYMSSGFSALSLVVESASDAGGVPGSFSTYAGTVVSGSNPNTATTQATLQLKGYYPWLRVTLGSKTGTGTIRGTLYGCVGTA